MNISNKQKIDNQIINKNIENNVLKENINTKNLHIFEDNEENKVKNININNENSIIIDNLIIRKIIEFQKYQKLLEIQRQKHGINIYKENIFL